MKDLIPIFVCCVLPVSIVLIVSLAAMNNDNKRAQVLIKAIEANNNIDADKLAEALSKPKKKKTAREILNGRLLKGCMFSLLGLILVVIGVVNFIMTLDFSSDPVTVPLIFGACLLSVGVSFLIVYFVTRRQTLSEESEEKSR